MRRFANRAHLVVRVHKRIRAPFARAITTLALVFVGVSCVEGPFEPFDPSRDDRVFRFLAGAASGLPLTALTPGAVFGDTALDVDLRLRDAPRVAALAFELVIDGPVVTLDTLRDGAFFVPADRVTVLEFASVGSNRWVGVVALDSLVPGVGGSGVLGTVRVRRTSVVAFESALRFDTTTTRAYDPAGATVAMRFSAGRIVHNPRAIAQ
ncbi:MAG: hypothetical protein ACKVS7_01495 [Gemmatimonadaceae bacterium]